MTRKILIVEDNIAHLQVLQKMVQDIQQDVIIFSADEVSSAYAIAMENRIDLFLIDIILSTDKPGDVSGLFFAQELRGISRYQFVPIIFITSLEDPKLFSYSQLHCYEYIEKPFDIKKVANTITNALKFPMMADQNKNIYFRNDGIVYSKCISEIICIENNRRRVTIHCVDDILEMPYKTCEKILQELDADCFIQCSRYSIVNKNFIESIDYTNRYIKMKHMEKAIELGIIMRREFKRKMENE